MKRLKKVLKILSLCLFSIFAIIGFGFTAVFVAMQFGFLNVRGTINERNQFFGSVPRVKAASITTATPPATVTAATTCETKDASGNDVPACAWNQSEEWSIVSAGLTKDIPVIAQVSGQTGISERMIASVVVPEQLRFFTSERESYKRFFEPLKILGTMSKFSLGVTGIKQDTAHKIEHNLADANSPFYPGPGSDQFITYPLSTSHDSIQYSRLTDSKNHYYEYLYAALCIKEIQAQWLKAGYDISQRPDILVTLYNIGFANSKPKDNPQVGGSPVTVGGTTYSFGELGTLFYQSDELVNPFPKTI